MSTTGNKVKLRLPIRKRLRRASKILFAVKQLSWRFTGGWLWFLLVSSVFGFRSRVQNWEASLSLHLNNSLIKLGFAPSHPAIFVACLEVLWLLTICTFSWAQLIGFFLYVPLLPFVLLAWIILRRTLEPYRKIREESFRKTRKAGISIPKRSWGFPLSCVLLLWFVLYGQTSAKYPLVLALILTALLFCSRVGSALVFAVPAHTGPWARIESMSVTARKFISDSLESLKTGEVLDRFHLNFKVWTASFLLRNFRLWSVYLHGKSARRRTALLVLLRFMFNLAFLGSLAILFWAIAIKLALSPAQVPLSQAILASASRAIPGVPDASALKIPALIQTLDALTAWLVFVLYAGPVASLFPAFQEQAILRSAANYARLRSERTALYRLRERLVPLQMLVRENPELANIGKAAIALRTHSEAEVRQALLSQPESLRALANAPVIADYMRKLGAPIPDLDGLVKEVPAIVEQKAPIEQKIPIEQKVPVHDAVARNSDREAS